MKIEKKQEEEWARRKGMTGKTIISAAWLTISGVAAYFFLNFLIESDNFNFSYGAIYRALSLPRQVPQWLVLAVMIIIIVLAMQIFLWLGFIIASPEGRRRTGDPSLHSRNKDPFGDRGY